MRRIRGIDDSAPDRPCPIDFDSASVKLRSELTGMGSAAQVMTQG